MALSSSPYITVEGKQALSDELEQRWLRRRDVVKALSAAAAEGDRSENAEYIYRKKELREIDRRIRYLQKRLPDLKVIDQVPDDQDRIFFAAWVTLETDEGEEVTYRIVGPDEIDAERGFISVDSPLSKALLGKTLDDEITLHIAGKKTDYAVLAIRY